ncbi:MAG: hypothetical protein JSW07_20045 [bacterium]|nr:MAG: hypothetical protein JSW07_20045 [bacterium]
MGNNIIIVGLCILFIFSTDLYGQVEAGKIESNAPTTQFATIDVLVVFYTNTAGSQISPEEISKLKKGIKLSREFYWRNSGCQLNLNISYLEIDEFKDKKFFPDDGLLLPKYVEQDFQDHGVQNDQYGIILLIYGPPSGGGNYGGMQILGNSGYSFFRYPCKSSVRYPGEDLEVNYLATWLFIHELQHSVDLLCYEKSGNPEMWHGDKPLDYSIQAGEEFSYQAEIFRNFKNYLKIKSPWGRIEQAKDFDGDHFPDNDDRVPMDEVRFGSDTTQVDSDLDGLTDLSEFMAGIYRSSDPNKADSDDDGINDKDDPFPLHLIHNEIPKMTPQFADGWSTWYPLSFHLDYSTAKFLMDNPLSVKTFMTWDENYLYFGCEMDAPAELHLDIDLLNNGWWHGKDNYRLVVDPFSDRFNVIRVMDTSNEVRRYRKSLGKGPYEMWDDDPQYISKFGKILVESSIVLKTEISEDKYRIKIKIPNNNRIPFKLEKGKKIGLRIYFTSPDLEISNSWATVYEQYEFFDVILKR